MFPTVMSFSNSIPSWPSRSGRFSPTLTESIVRPSRYGWRETPAMSCHLSPMVLFRELERRQIADNAKKESDAARDRLEQTSARSLARALNPEVEGSKTAGLTDPETEALWELAESTDERLRVRFLDEATRSAMTAYQLCSRSEPTLIAAVGLGSSRRVRAAELLLGRIRERDLTVEHRSNLAVVALANEDSLGPTTVECTKIIVDALVSNTGRKRGRSDVRSSDMERPRHRGSDPLVNAASWLDRY